MGRRTRIRNVVSGVFGSRMTKAKTNRRSRPVSCHRPEQLEQRLAFALATFVEPTPDDGQPRAVTLVSSPGSDLYVTKIAGDTLWAAESSTFVGRSEIPNISAQGTLAITTGVIKQDFGLDAVNYPMAGPNLTLTQTTFALSKGYIAQLTSDAVSEDWYECL